MGTCYSSAPITITAVFAAAAVVGSGVEHSKALLGGREVSEALLCGRGISGGSTLWGSMEGTTPPEVAVESVQ